MADTVTISIPDMLEGRFDNPLRPGASLATTGRFLGAPRHWDFGGDDPLSCQMNYDDFELHYLARGGGLKLENFWVELWDTPEGEPEAKRKRIRVARGRGIRVTLGPFTPGASPADVKAALHGRWMDFRESEPETAFETVRILRLSTGTELHFFKMKGSEGLAEIHFCSLEPLEGG